MRGNERIVADPSITDWLRKGCGDSPRTPVIAQSQEETIFGSFPVELRHNHHPRPWCEIQHRSFQALPMQSLGLSVRGEHHKAHRAQAQTHSRPATRRNKRGSLSRFHSERIADVDSEIVSSKPHSVHCSPVAHQCSFSECISHSRRFVADPSFTGWLTTCGR